VIVLMGVCGCGKTTVGKVLAERLGWEFVEGDSFHSQANIAKMSRGVALDDADRWPWLKTLADEITRRIDEQRPMVLACSALKQAYRDVLQVDGEQVRFVFLEGSRQLIAERLNRRQGHYMPASLLESQFTALEPPRDAEGMTVIPADQSVDEIAQQVISALKT